jgi:hypothetical protein
MVAATRPSSPLRRSTVYRWEHPDWWLLVVAVGAWTILLAETIGSPDTSSGQTHHKGSSSDWSESATWLAWWLLMVAAMMMPLAMRDARWLAHRSLARRRGRTVALHVLGFLLVWTGLGAVVAAAVSTIGLGTRAAAISLAAAAVWHVSPVRRRVLGRCGPGRAPAIRGLRADTDCVLAGTRTGRLCLITCGFPMVAMGATHSIAVMGAVAMIGASERRRGPNPEDRAARPTEAAALAVVAAAVALL